MGQDKKQKRVWVDTDMAIGHKSGRIGYCDVDDGYALAALVRSKNVRVVGVSSTLGNTNDIQVSTNTVEKFMDAYGTYPVDLHAGATAAIPTDIAVTETNAAVEHLAQALRDDRLTILAIGAATNIGILMLKYPELEKRIDEIVLVAGRRGRSQHFFSGHWQPKPFRDLNFEADPLAFEILLKGSVQLTLVPFETCHQVWIRPQDIVKMRCSNAVGHYLAVHSMGWLAEWEIAFGANGFNPFDLVAAGYVVNPDHFTWHKWNANIEKGTDDTHPGNTKKYLVCNEDLDHGCKVNYCTTVSDDCKIFLMERIASHEISACIMGLSHINVVVPCVEEATEFYGRVLGFKPAYDPDGAKMDYSGVEMNSFALDAGIMDEPVNVDVRFLKHPQAGIYLELMAYHAPKGNGQIPPQPKTFDMGGARHIAMEVSDCQEVFDYLRRQQGVTMINTSEEYRPVELDGFPITFFYWVDQYGIQWEMEEGRPMGTSRGII